MSDQRILFVCGTLAPGLDGVGDYTRRLAGELGTRGIPTFLIASHDKRTDTIISEPGLLRIPYAYNAAQRIPLLRRAIHDFAPSFTSLQYVPYSFNNKGAPLAFVWAARQLRDLGPWHLMFHELWVDDRGWATPKNYAIARLQQLCARLLVDALRPSVMHTQLPAYQSRLLEQTNIRVHPLPLFANIAPALPAPRPAGKNYRVGFFSQMELAPAILTFISRLRQWLTATDRTLTVALLGGSAQKVSATATELRGQFADLDVDPLGFLDEEELSTRLYELDLGITPVRYHAIGKSGTVAAFLTHRRPVAVPCVTEAGPSFFSAGLTEATLAEFSPEGLNRATEAAHRLDLTPITVAGVADRFLQDLQSSGK